MQLERAVQALCDHQVEFVIIGGVAATLHGSSRVTYDLDVCYSRSSPNLKRLITALAPFHPRPRGFPESLPFDWDDATLRNATVLTLQTEIGEIDLLAEVAGLGGFQQVQAHALPVSAFGREFLALDLHGLILAKRASGRPKDLDALPELEGLLETEES
jgi:predicted nucleotidyltransferase